MVIVPFVFCLFFPPVLVGETKHAHHTNPACPAASFFFISSCMPVLVLHLRCLAETADKWRERELCVCFLHSLITAADCVTAGQTYYYIEVPWTKNRRVDLVSLIPSYYPTIPLSFYHTIILSFLHTSHPSSRYIQPYLPRVFVSLFILRIFSALLSSGWPSRFLQLAPPSPSYHAYLNLHHNVV